MGWPSLRVGDFDSERGWISLFRLGSMPDGAVKLRKQGADMAFWGHQGSKMTIAPLDACKVGSPDYYRSRCFAESFLPQHSWVWS